MRVNPNGGRHEKDLPTQKETAQQGSRIQKKNADQGRQKRIGKASS